MKKKCFKQLRVKNEKINVLKNFVLKQYRVKNKAQSGHCFKVFGGMRFGIRNNH